MSAELPIESLSDVAWARVERGVMARLDGTVTRQMIPERTSARRWWLALPIVAAAAGALVYVATAGSSSPPVASPIVAEEPARVVAGASPSAVSFGDAHITLDADSAIVMDREDGKPTALLEHGAAWFSVAPRGDRPPFQVRAGDAIVRVIGTRFRVARDGEHAEVAVDHGTVEVRFRGHFVAITAGHSWTSDKPGELATVAPPAEPEIEMAPDPVRVHRPRHAAGAPKLPPAVAAADPDRARYEALAKLEAKHADAAMKGYLELSGGSSPWSEVSLYAAARLAADRGDVRASTLLTIYLRRFPSGANSTDARELLSRIKGEP